MSDMDDIIGNLNASVAELEKALTVAESAGLTSKNVAGLLGNRRKAGLLQTDRRYSCS